MHGHVKVQGAVFELNGVPVTLLAHSNLLVLAGLDQGFANELISPSLFEPSGRDYC